MYAANNQTVSNVYLTNIYLSIDASLTDACVTQNKKITTDICSKKLHVIIAIIFTNVASTVFNVLEKLHYFHSECGYRQIVKCVGGKKQFIYR